MPELPTFEWFDPTILAPSFFCRTINAIAEDDADYLMTELHRHHFYVRELPGAEMHDHHGYKLHLARAFGLLTSKLGDGAAVIPDFAALLSKEAPRRTAFVVRDADRLLEADMQRALALQAGIQQAADELADRANPIQLLAFLVGPAPSFRKVDASAKERAHRRESVKLTATDLGTCQWSHPQDFDLLAHHQLLLAPAAWYYAALGRRAESSDDRWACYEQDDVLTFVRLEDKRPCIAGVFARMGDGMRLVGVRYEGDESVFRMPWEAEDPFTLFRRLCETLHVA